jgi:hypothetical protein
MKNRLLSLLLFAGLLMTPGAAFAHCDTKDGPVVADARKAIAQNNINYVLKWVPQANENDIKDAFGMTMKVRGLSPEAEALADNYFFETLVRIHRSAEGVAYTGVKPSGTPVDEKILAADKSIEAEDLSALINLVPKDKLTELRRLFDRVILLKDFDVNNVPAGRAYVEAYVRFFHFAEGEGEHNHSHSAVGAHSAHIPWILSGILLIVSVWLGILYYRKKQ